MKLYNIDMADYNRMAINFAFIIIVILIFVRSLTAIFDFYGLSPASYLNYILFFVALGLFSLLLPNVRGQIFYN